VEEAAAVATLLNVLLVCSMWYILPHKSV